MDHPDLSPDYITDRLHETGVVDVTPFISEQHDEPSNLPNPEIIDTETPATPKNDGMSRRGFLRLAGIAATTLLAGSSGNNIYSGTNEHPSLISEQHHKLPNTEVIKSVAETMPKPPEFSELSLRINSPETPDGAFMGAMTVRYADNPDRSLQSEEGLIDKYWQSKGLPRPAVNNPSVHRLRVGGSITSENVKAFDPLLDEAAVVHKGTDSGLILIAQHNITQVKGPVELDGAIYDHLQMGINEYVMPGDTLEIVLSNQQQPGFLDVFRFVATGSRVVAYPEDLETVYEYNPEEGKEQAGDLAVLKTYICWPPGQKRYRLVVEWEPQNTAIVHGTVNPV